MSSKRRHKECNFTYKKFWKTVRNLDCQKADECFPEEGRSGREMTHAQKEIW